jgi:hypothetical protein
MKKSKRALKEKILQYTGITGNTKEEKVRIAENILEDTEFKQELCLDNPGLDFAFIEKAMKEVIRNNKKKDYERDWEEAEEESDLPPEMPSIIPDQFNKKITLSHYTPQETSDLVRSMYSKK